MAARVAASSDSLVGRVAVVTGASRGIGRSVALALGRAGASVVLAAKSSDNSLVKGNSSFPAQTSSAKNLPGSIESVAAEVRACNPLARALAVQCDVRSEEDMERCVARAVEEFGGVDILINNASALWWHDIRGTPLKKFDLITTINSRASFAMTALCLPHMEKRGWGRVVCMSPPIYTRPPAMVGKVAYNISKFGMTLTALGVAQEYGPTRNILANSLWPATIIESQASINFELGERRDWRKADILADCCVQLCLDETTNGETLIDDLYLQSRGWTEENMRAYRCEPEHEPRRLLDIYTGTEPDDSVSSLRRGDVKRVDLDKKLQAKL